MGGGKAESIGSKQSNDLIEGFWTVEFVGPAFQAAGVVVFIAGQIWGGDATHMYTGNYDGSAEIMKATVDVRPFVAGAQTVFGTVANSFQLTLTGTVRTGAIDATGYIAALPSLSIRMRLTKRAELPLSYRR